MANPEDEKLEIDRVRARIHNLADKVHGHEIFHETHRVKIEANEREITELRLDIHTALAGVRTETATKTELAAFTALSTEKMVNLQRGIDKANGILEKLAWTIIIAVILAIMSLVIVKRDAVGGALSWFQIIPDAAAYMPLR